MTADAMPCPPEIGLPRRPGTASIGLAALLAGAPIAPAGLAAVPAQTWGMPQPVRGCPVLPGIGMEASGGAVEYHGLNGGLVTVSIPWDGPPRGLVRAESHAKTLCMLIPIAARTGLSGGPMLVVDYHAEDRVGWAKVGIEVRTDQGSTGFGWLGGEVAHGRTRVPLSPDEILSRGGVTVTVEVVVATFGGGATATLDSISLGDL